jgi:sigma-B regulation protein RsbU (phosphoserine phosphatase)
VTTPSAPRLSYFRTLPGRLFVLSSVLIVILFAAARFTTLPLFVEVLGKVVRLAWIVSSVWLLLSAIARNRRRFLWRVRQKLILSYVFLGFVPVLLVVALALMGGWVLYTNLAGYMFREGFDDVRNSITQSAETAATELGRTPDVAADAIARRYANLAPRYPALSLAVIPLTKAGGAPVKAGAWRHVPAPTEAPPWLAGSAVGFRGVTAVPVPSAPGDWMLVIRSAVPTKDGSRAVVVDLPVDAAIVAEIEARSETRMEGVTVGEKCGGPPAGTADSPAPPGVGLFKRSVAYLVCTNWDTGETGTASIGLNAPFARLYTRLDGLRTPGAPPNIFLYALIVLAVLFLIIQGSALVMGAVLARSITYAVHELFRGTERIQQGDFTHRIDSGDQLGDLANSYNRMSSSIEHLLHVQREKQRLDDELRIARDIQKSLLPAAPPVIAGIGIADLCEPARQVGGDYYDFFELGPGRLGVMVADVSGKGTSAALYMAELKGLMLALSRKEESPRLLLIEANRLLAAHLDNRSFITMTYAVIDLNTRTLTCARAGHTPMIVISNGHSEIVTPSGMVLGLRLPGAAERFEQVLEEHTRPLATGDVIVLYTDGISEAMNENGDLFSDEALARVVEGQHGHDAAEIRERVVREVRAFVGTAEPHDDMTMIVLKLEGMRES